MTFCLALFFAQLAVTLFAVVKEKKQSTAFDEEKLSYRS